MGSITLSMIIKNEEKYLEDCLKSARNIVDEIVIVDTGSTDKSLQIAEKYGAKIYFFDWINDFAAARNFALSKSSGDWILYLDADERLSENSHLDLKQASELPGKYGIRCKVISNNSLKKNRQVFKYVRFFKNDPAVKFEGKIHEQIEFSLLENNYEILDSEIKINHLGYDISQEELNQKAVRNLKLLEDEYKQNPTGYVLYQIGQTYLVMDKKDEAIPYFYQCIEDPNLEINHAAQAYRILAADELRKGDYKKAEEFIETALEFAPDQVLNSFVAAQIYSAKLDFQKSEEFFRQALDKNRTLSLKENSFLDTGFEETDLVRFGLHLAVQSSNKNLFNEFCESYIQNSDNQEIKDQLNLYNSLLNNFSLDQNIIDKTFDILRNLDKNKFLELAANYNHTDKEKLIFTLLENRFTNLEFNQNAIEYFFNKKEITKVERVLDYMNSHCSDDPKTVLALIKYFSVFQQFDKMRSLIQKSLITFEKYPQVISILNSINSKLNAEIAVKSQ